MRNIALKIAYCGRHFCGWQSQPEQRTVEDELRRALGALHKVSRGDIRLYAAGRTDSGVHASGQVANFYSPISPQNLPVARFREALNSLLPRDIRILYSWDVPADFHARYSARARVYQYRIIQAAACRPESREQAWHLRCPRLDTTVLNSIVSPVLGQHNFRAFTVAGDRAKSKVRRIYAASWYWEGGRLVFRIAGNAFLWHMVRCIVGTAVGLYTQAYKDEHIQVEPREAKPREAEPQNKQENSGSENLANSTQSLDKTIWSSYLNKKMAAFLQGGQHTGFMAPACGLELTRVIYDHGDPWQL